ncbi:FtsX-like permease family protein [Citrobacter braakii]|uniref:FtsX-like permease family protein n=1 Tax=Citrobacter braakii TaxID=57706 RepID=UPI002B24C7DF|nr:FtsX-like permease family protein [Citrobacter braakii]MEB0968003.1 FtsX-like permease family protein [Citrobacter braakii]
MMSFLVIGFTGITLTDSMIYSTSLQAQAELNVNGDEVLSVDFSKPYSGKKIEMLFNDEAYTLSKIKEMFFFIGSSPFSDDMKLVVGVDKHKFNSLLPDNKVEFKGSVIIVPNDAPFNKGENVFLNGVPFKVIGKVKRKKTDFLDSLGISTAKFNSKYLIPLETMYRLVLDDHISSVDFIKKEQIAPEDIALVKKVLSDNDVNDFSIHSVLDAKETVKKVFDRFSILTNSVYILLTIMVVVIIVVSCRKIFQSRTIEFSLKIIHGIDKKIIIRIVIVEVVLIILASILMSTFLTTMLIHILSKIFEIKMHIRLFMISASFIIVVISCYLTSIFSGNQFFKINPVKLIKNSL